MGSTLQIQLKRRHIEQPLQSSADCSGQYSFSESKASAQSDWWSTTIFFQDDIFISGHCHPLQEHKETTCLSAAQKSVSMTTLVFKLPSCLWHRSWHKVSYHCIYPHPFLFCFRFFLFDFFASRWVVLYYYCPYHSSQALSSPPSHFSFFVQLFFDKGLYFPRMDPWVKMKNISEEIQVKFLFFLRHRADSLLKFFPQHY